MSTYLVKRFGLSARYKGRFTNGENLMLWVAGGAGRLLSQT